MPFAAGGGAGGSVLAGPSAACSPANRAGVSAAPPTGFSGPVTVVNRPVARSLAAAVASTAGSCQAGPGSLKMMLVGLADDSGKYLASRAVPWAESLADGAVVVPPKPLALYPVEASASRPKDTTPMTSVGTGCRTMRPATRPQAPAPPEDWMLHGMSFSRPKMRANTR